MRERLPIQCGKNGALDALFAVASACIASQCSISRAQACPVGTCCITSSRPSARGRWLRRTTNAAPWRKAAKVVTNIGSGVSEVVASQVSVRDLKTHLSEWLARAQSGEVVEVTSHRKPIARITAVQPADSGIRSPLQKAIDAGLISWNGEKPNLPPPVKLRGQGKLLSDIVIEDRG